MAQNTQNSVKKPSAQAQPTQAKPTAQARPNTQAKPTAQAQPTSAKPTAQARPNTPAKPTAQARPNTPAKQSAEVQEIKKDVQRNDQKENQRDNRRKDAPVTAKTNTHSPNRGTSDRGGQRPTRTDRPTDNHSEPKRKGPSESWNVGMPWLLGAVSVFLLLLYSIVFIGRLAGKGDMSAGIVGAFIRNLFLWLFGWAAYMIPAALMTVALRWRGITKKGMTHGGLWAQCVSVLFLTGSIFEILFDGGINFSQFGYYLQGFSTFVLYAPGGFFGGTIGLAMRAALNSVFSAIILILVDLLLILFFTGMTPERIFRYIKERVEINREIRARAKEEERENAALEAELKEAERKAAEAAKKEEERKKREEEAIKRVSEREQKRREAEAKLAAKEAEKEQKKKEAELKKNGEAPKTIDPSKPSEPLKLPDTDELPFDDDNPYKLPEVKDDPIMLIEDLTENEKTAERKSEDKKPEDKKPEDQKLEDQKTEEKKTEEQKPEEKKAAPMPENEKKDAEPVTPESPSDREAQPVHTEAEKPSETVLDEPLQPIRKSVSAVDLQYDLDEERAKLPKTALPGDDELILKWDHPKKSSESIEDPLFPELLSDDEDEEDSEEDTVTASPDTATEHEEHETNEDSLESLDPVEDDTGLLGLPNDLDALENEDEPTETESLPETPESTEPPPPEYYYPPVSLLEKGEDAIDASVYTAEIEAKKEELAATLRSFGIRFRSIEYSRGPTITRYEIQPEPGQRVKSIQNLMDDIALNMAVSGVRFEPSISGKSAVGIEVPNDRRETVTLRSLVESDTFTCESSKLTACLGADITGKPVVFDVSKMPHLLVAGATGMGKSVCINSIIVSLMYKAKPEELRLILIDPKKVEFAIYRDMPHLLTPIITDPQKAAGALCSAVSEMEKRFELIERVGARDIKGYKKITAGDPDMPRMSHIVIIIDELADLMMTASNDVEAAIMRIAQKARAAGIHLIIGTQRPSVDVITGTIKANIPSRIACTVASQTDSRTILDAQGAEKLCGRGDMLFAPVGASRPRRVQGSFVSDDEVIRVVNYMINNNGTALYDEQFMENINLEAERCLSSKKASAEAAMIAESDEDPKFGDAVVLAIECGKISTSLLQRRLEVGYGRAAKIIDRMEELGYVSEAEGNKPRKILVTMDEYLARASGEVSEE